MKSDRKAAARSVGYEGARESRATPQSIRLVKRLKAAGAPLELADDAYYIRRTYVGRNQRSQGAWSWFLWTDGLPKPEVGSQTPIRELLAGEIEIHQQRETGDWFVDPHNATPGVE